MILIATPTKETVNAGFAYDLAQLLGREKSVKFAISQGTLLCNQRTELVKKMLDAHLFSHILFIDSDMRFPEDTVERLLAHKLDIVGANCVHRGSNKTNTGIKSKGKKGLEEVDHIGFGVILISMKAFSSIPEPWFATPYDGQKFIGEDIFFCHKAKKQGLKLWVDHDLSLQVKHEGLKAWEH